MANDHQVPQSYLRNFEIPNPPHPIPLKHIYSYKRGFSPIHKAIKSIACEDDYYTVKEGIYAQYSKGNNHILSTFENHSSLILKRIINKIDIALSKREKWTLAHFISTLSIRNPLVHDYFKNQILNEGKSRIQSLAHHKSSFHNLLRELEPNFSEKKAEKTRQIFLEIDKHLVFSLPDEAHNKSYIRSQLTAAHYVILARRLFYYHWHLLIIKSEEYFITSDNPVVFLFPRLKDVLSLWQCPVFLPISPKVALLIHPFSYAEKKIFIEDDLVDFYVKQSILFAKDAVFSHTKSQEIQKLFDETEQNINDLNYQYNFLPLQKLKFFLRKGIIKI